MLNETEIANLRLAGSKLMEVFKALKPLVKPGTNALELESLAQQKIAELGGEPSFLGYNGYPAVTCLTINDAVVHGIPPDYILKEGDIIGVDIGLKYEGIHADSSVTWPVGTISPEARNLLEGTYEALQAGIAVVREGVEVNDISKAVESVLRKRKISTFKQFVGHQIGRQLHGGLYVPNFSSKGPSPRLQSGMAIAIEPITGLGEEDFTTEEDGWTTRSVDGSLAANFEATVLITPEGHEVMTRIEELL